MQKSALLAAIQQEIQRHDFSHFIDEPPSVAEGGNGVVVPGCPVCRKRINTIGQFRDSSLASKRCAVANQTISQRTGFLNA